MITLLIRPNNFSGFNKRNSQEKLHLLVLSLSGRITPPITPKYSQGINQVRKNSLNITFLDGIFLGHPGPRRWDIPDKNFMQAALFFCFRQEVAGMSRDLGRTLCKKTLG